MAEKAVSEKALQYMELLNRETGNRHHTDTEDMRQYELLRAGDPGAVDEAVRMFSSNLPGHVSDDPVRNDRSGASLWPAARLSRAGWRRSGPTTSAICTS